MKYFLILFLLTACSLNKIVINLASPIVDGGIAALFQEEDAEFAGSAMPGLIKLLEGFIQSDSNNVELLVNASMGYAAYALGYIEDENPTRAKEFYLKSMRYGFMALRLNAKFKIAEQTNYETFKQALQSFDKSDVPALFWSAISWGLWINLSLDNPEAMAKLSYVEAMMLRVKSLQEDYFGGGADLFFGVIECVKPPMIGGDPEKGKRHFEQSLKLSENDFLLTKAFMLQYYSTAILDEELFDSLAKEILENSLTKYKINSLPNALAKKKVRFLMSKKEELF